MQFQFCQAFGTLRAPVSPSTLAGLFLMLMLRANRRTKAPTMLMRWNRQAPWQVPLIVDSSNCRHLCQSAAILEYLADETGKFGGANLQERMDAREWEGRLSPPRHEARFRQMIAGRAAADADAPLTDSRNLRPCGSLGGHEARRETQSGALGTRYGDNRVRVGLDLPHCGSSRSRALHERSARCPGLAASDLAGPSDVTSDQPRARPAPQPQTRPGSHCKSAPDPLG